MMHILNLRLLLLTSIFVFTWITAAATEAADYTPEQLEEWFFDDRDASELIDRVNEGDLVFLDQPPAKAVHHHHNTLVIREQSLQDGWVTLRQCHENIDRVRLAEVVFSPDRVRSLRVVHYENIEKAWVENASVQLLNVGENARLCIGAESNSLVNNGNGSFVLRNGPFMRKFLDGYYPMRVSMDVEMKTGALRFHAITPKMQKGFRVWHTRDSVHFDAWFEGMLRTEIHFSGSYAVNRTAVIIP